MEGNTPLLPIENNVTGISNIPRGQCKKILQSNFKLIKTVTSKHKTKPCSKLYNLRLRQ